MFLSVAPYRQRLAYIVFLCYCAERVINVQSFGKMGLGPRGGMPARPWGQRIGSNDKHNEWKLFIGQVPLEVTALPELSCSDLSVSLSTGKACLSLCGVSQSASTPYSIVRTGSAEGNEAAAIP